MTFGQKEDKKIGAPVDYIDLMGRHTNDIDAVMGGCKLNRVEVQNNNFAIWVDN